MKKIVILVLFWILIIPSVPRGEERTLLGKIVDRGEFSTTVGKTTVIDGEGALLFGGYGGRSFNRMLSVGWGTYFLLPFLSISGSRLYMAYTGFDLGVTIAPDALIHPAFHSLFGFGGALYDFNFKRGDFFFVIDPSASLEINLTKRVRVGAGAGYRFVSGVDGMRGLDNESLSGLSFELAFKWSLSRGRLSGKSTVETRDLPAFDSVHLMNEGTVYVSREREQSVEIYADESVIDIVRTEVRNGILFISSRHDIRRISSFEVHVVMKEIEELSVTGPGSIRGKGSLEVEDLELRMTGSGDISLDLNADKVVTHISGSGEIELSGRAEDHEVKISGSGDLEAGELSTEDTRVTLSGSGKCMINATENLDVRISGSGDVSYRGNPNLSSHITGSGRINRED
jgi:hypothetical protein